MARGHQKLQAQAKNQKRQEEMKKGKGSDQKTAAQAALHHKCSVCMVSQSIDKHTYFICCVGDDARSENVQTTFRIKTS